MSDDERYHLPTPDLGVFGDGERSDAEHTDAEHSAEHDGPRGTMRFQDPDSTTRRQPTLSERHARQQAERQEAEAARRAAEEHEAAALRAQRRKRIMIGGGVTVGVVALVGAWYLFASPDTVSAQCTVSNGSNPNTVVAEQNCDPQYAQSHGGYVNNGFVFVPLLTGGYGQYRYYYGGAGGIGTHVSGGSFSKPGNATIRTNSGRTIQRGGFGITGKLGGSGGS